MQKELDFEQIYFNFRNTIVNEIFKLDNPILLEKIDSILLDDNKLIYNKISKEKKSEEFLNKQQLEFVESLIKKYENSKPTSNLNWTHVFEDINNVINTYGEEIPIGLRLLTKTIELFIINKIEYEENELLKINLGFINEWLDNIELNDEYLCEINENSLKTGRYNFKIVKCPIIIKPNYDNEEWKNLLSDESNHVSLKYKVGDYIVSHKFNAEITVSNKNFYFVSEKSIAFKYKSHE